MTRLADTIAREFGTPAVVVDLDVVEANVTAVQALCDHLGLANRPHIKTHKSPELAKLQVEAGAQGITCQKLGEAEVMVEAGLNDILISYNILGEQKLRRLGTLLERARITVAADSAATIDGLATCAALASQPLPVVVECDTGMKRAGVETPGEAVALSCRIAATAGLTFAGLLFYPPPDGWERTQRFLDTVSSGLHEAGLTQVSSRPAARPTSHISVPFEAPRSTGPAPTSSTIACRWQQASQPWPIAHSRSTPPW